MVLVAVTAVLVAVHVGVVRSGRANTSVAATVVSVTSPLAPTLPPTQTSANDGSESPKNFVLASTLTVKVSPFQLVSVKEPVAPSVPQVPGSLTPFTEATSPNTWWCSCCWSSPESSCFAGAMNTLAAVTIVSSTVPLAPTRPPTHTFANDGSVTSFAMYSVVVSTFTVKVWFSCAVSVNDPAAPAVPQVFGSLTPLHRRDDPEGALALVGRDHDDLRRGHRRVRRREPLAATRPPTHTFANDGSVTASVAVLGRGVDVHDEHRAVARGERERSRATVGAAGVRVAHAVDRRDHADQRRASCTCGGGAARPCARTGAAARPRASARSRRARR